MSQCSVCQHPERVVIEGDLRSSEKPDWSTLRRKYGLKHHLALMVHKRLHMTPFAPPMISEILTSTHNAELQDNEMQVTQNPLRQFTRAIETAADAYQLAQDDPQMQAHMRERLQEKIKLMVQAED